MSGLVFVSIIAFSFILCSFLVPYLSYECSNFQNVAFLNDVIEFDVHSVFFPFSWQVLVTNQLTTKVGPGNDSHLVPALGDSFGHYSNQRLMLGYLQHDWYAAVLFKSVRKPQSSVKFQVVITVVWYLWCLIKKFIFAILS